MEDALIDPELMADVVRRAEQDRRTALAALMVDRTPARMAEAANAIRRHKELLAEQRKNDRALTQKRGGLTPVEEAALAYLGMTAGEYLTKRDARKEQGR